jgi:hypothetical protein
VLRLALITTVYVGRVIVEVKVGRRYPHSRWFCEPSHVGLDDSLAIPVSLFVLEVLCE